MNRLPGGKTLTPPEEFAEHMVRIDNQWTCTTCVVNFRDKTDCRRHVEAKHIQSTIYECGLCLFKCRTEYSYRKHERQHEKDLMQAYPPVPELEMEESDYILRPPDFGEIKEVNFGGGGENDNGNGGDSNDGQQKVSERPDSDSGGPTSPPPIASHVSSSQTSSPPNSSA